MRYVTEQGVSISLDKQIAEDNEAIVYDVAGDADHVAKIYRKPPLEKQARKLAEMVRMAAADIPKDAAWPLAILRQAADQPVRGILMRKIKGAQPLALLHSPARRRFAFPQADWRFLIRAARNCALAVTGLHHAGVVVGDVNSGRFLVNDEAAVAIVGCDSFQLIHGEEVFFSRTAVPEYAAPELQNIPVESFPLTRNHDAFGLAVVIFRLLMMGRHPFAGFRGPHKMPVSQAIHEYRFAFGSTAAAQMMEPPPHSLLLSDLPAPLAGLFERAFSRGSEREGARPTPLEWMKLLDELERQTVPCSADPGHFYVSGLPQCPWCRIEREGGPSYFITVTMHALESSPQPADTQQILDEFETIAPPDSYFAELAAAPLLPATPAPLPAGTREFQQLVVALGVLTVGSALLMLLGFLSVNFIYIAATITVCLSVGWLLAYFGSPLFRIRRKRRRVLAAKKAELAQLQRDMAQDCTRLNTEWMPRFKAAAEVRDKLRSLEDQEAHDMRVLQASLRERQLSDYLSRFFLRDAKIDKLSPGRMTVLESFNIETARDITERALASAPGVGEVQATTLLAWRRGAESGFSFDPQRGLPQADVAKVRNKYLQQRLALQEQLEVDCDALARVSSNARLHAGRYTVPLAAAQSAVVQATADVKACR